METIKTKIKQLLLLSNTEVDNLMVKMRQQEKMWNELSQLARNNNTLLGRIVKFQYADSHAYYIITKVNKRNVVITWLDYCDRWVDDRCGKNAYLSLEYAAELIRREDSTCKVYD
jgi:hypothetical protein